MEALVLDNGTGDPAALRRVADAFAPMVRLLRVGGEGSALNRGLAAARSPYVAVLAEGEAYGPDLLAASVAALERAPEAIGTYPDWQLVDAAGQRLEEHRLPDFDRRLMLLRHLCLPGPGAVIRREVLQQIGGYDPDLHEAAVFDLWLRATAQGPLVHLPRPLATRRPSPLTPERRARWAREAVEALRRFLATPEEAGWTAAERATALAAAHLAAAKLLDSTAPEEAARHLTEAERLDPTLLDPTLPHLRADAPSAGPHRPPEPGVDATQGEASGATARRGEAVTVPAARRRAPPAAAGRGGPASRGHTPARR